MSTELRVEQLVSAGGDVLRVVAEATITEAAKKMLQHRVGCLVAMNSQERIGGIITERDILNKIVAASRDPNTVRVAEIMTRDLVAVSPKTPVSRAMEIMAQNGMRHVPVIRQGQLVGILSMRDLLSQQLSAAEACMQRQAVTLQDIEKKDPGLAQLQEDSAGRVVL